jgi:carbon starvation protein
VLGTFATLAPAAGFLYFSDGGAYLKFWTLFGASNQLLAALTLLSIAVWLKKEGRGNLFVVVPLCFLLVVTLWALASIACASFAASEGWDVARANGAVAVILVGLALFLAARAVRELRRAS